MSETKRLRERIAVVLANITLGKGWKDPRETLARTEEMLRDPIESDPPDSRDSLIAQLRTELAACHKVIIDAMTALGDGSIRQLSDNVRTLSLCDRISAAENILDSAPEPDDETLATIEDAGGDDAQS